MPSDRPIPGLAVLPYLPFLIGLPFLPLATVATAQGADPAPAPAKVQKLEEWPAVAEPQKQRVLALVTQFRKDDPQLRQDAADQLVAVGLGAVPLLFMQVTDRPENVNESIFGVLDRLLQREHTALLAREAKKNKLELRRYLVTKLAHFADPEMAPVLRAMTKDKDDDVVFAAHVGLCGVGEQASLQPLLDRCRKKWDEVRPFVAAVLPHARGKAMADAVTARIKDQQPAMQAAGLRLLRYLGTKEDTVVVVRNYLAAEDHAVKKEAVNAMRALHGQEPLETLSVFDAITMAKEWQAR